jgi:hypothetical protein
MPLFVHRIFHYAPSKPRHPLLRLLFALVGLVLLAVLIVGGLFVGLGMLLFAATRRLLRGGSASAGAPTPSVERVIDGEYSVVSKPRTQLGLQ